MEIVSFQLYADRILGEWWKSFVLDFFGTFWFQSFLYLSINLWKLTYHPYFKVTQEYKTYIKAGVKDSYKVFRIFKIFAKKS